MKIEVTGVSVSKKGTVWLQAKLLEGEPPRTQTVFECSEVNTPAKEDDKENSDALDAL